MAGLCPERLSRAGSTRPRIDTGDGAVVESNIESRAEVRTGCGLAAQVDALCWPSSRLLQASDLHKHHGGPRGDRTHNPRIKSPLLCQLS